MFKFFIMKDDTFSENDTKCEIQSKRIERNRVYSFWVYAKDKVNSRLKDKCLHALIDIPNPTLRSVDDIDGNVRTREFYSITSE